MTQKTAIQLTCVLVIAFGFSVGCQKADKTTEFRNKRSLAVKDDQLNTVKTTKDTVQEEDETVQEEDKTVAESTQEIVEDLKKQQEAEEAKTLELDKAREEAEAKELKSLITEIVHDNETDKEKRSVKRVGKNDIWIDPKKREVIVAGKICLRDGPLEMFVTPMGQKTHETVVTVNAWASDVHICLASCGIMPGSPVEFGPVYTPAHGPKVDIEIAWKEGDKIVRRSAQEMIRNAETQEAMKTHWVFGGSQAVPSEGYYGDGGALVCLSNFTIATLDIPIKSESTDAFLLYEAFTENIPEVNTQVFVYFKPQVEGNRVADVEDIAKEVQRITSSLPNVDNE